MNTRDLKRPDRPTRKFSPEELRGLITACKNKTDPEDAERRGSYPFGLDNEDAERIAEWQAGERPEASQGDASE